MTGRVDIRAGITLALAELRAAHAAQGRAIIALEMVLEASLQQGLNALPAVTAPVSQHRKEHRSGRAPKIDNDPAEWRASHRSGNPLRLDTASVLRAFVLERIEALTYDQIMQAGAAAFPPDRRTSRSTLSRWFRSQNRSVAGASTR